MSAVVDNANLSEKGGTMNHSTILSDLARIHQADLLREAEAQAMLKRAGITSTMRPKRLPTIAAFGVALILMLVIFPVQAASSEHYPGSLGARQNSAPSAPASCGTPQALGVEGGLLSLLNAREGPNAVAEIVSSQRYSLRTVRNELAYVPTVCS